MSHTHKHITVLALATLMISTALPASSVAAHGDLDMSRRKYGAILPDHYYDGLAMCETAGDWNHSTRSYTGGLGINRGTFARWSNRSPRRGARGMTPREQIRVADRIAFSGYQPSDGAFVWPVGPWGWGCLKGRKSLQRYICASTHWRVQKWKRGC